MEKERNTVDVANSTVVPRMGYTEALEEIVAGGFCPFCEEHLFKHHQRPVEHKTEHWLVTPSSWPYEGTKHHFLFIAREHVEAIEALSPKAWGDLHGAYRLVVERHGLMGATLMIRSGETKFTGATVNHLHANLYVGGPRKGGAEPIKALVAFKQ